MPITIYPNSLKKRNENGTYSNVVPGIDYTNQIFADIADEYSAQATYAVGDYCIHGGTLYRCTTAISTAEAWTAAHWTTANVGDELTGKVDKVPNKGLSTEDYTAAEKAKLAGIEAQANKTVIDNTLTQTGQAADAKKTGDAVGELKNTLNHKADVIYDTASGDIASFPDGADGLPVKDLTVGIEPVQSGTGDPSPTNVRPISGWTGANVTRTGFNVWDEEWENGSYSTSIGEFISNLNKICSKNLIPVTPNTTYYLKPPSTSDGLNVFLYDGGKNYLRYKEVDYISDRCLFAAPSDCYFIHFSTFGTGTTTYKNDININISDPAKNGTYEPGHVVTIPISWQSSAGTVYGGTLDVTTGVLTVTMAMVDLGTHGWFTEGTYFYAYPGNVKNPGIYEIPDAICSQYKANTWENMGADFNFYIFGDAVRIYDSRYTTVEDFKAAMSGVQLVYELATPLVYNLTPTEVITTLLGQNNIWTDCGPSTVEYPADTKLYIQKINTPTDDDMIADANIASGKYFIVNNNLYISTAAILAGDPIKPGTNCTLTNLAAALNAINS